MQIKDGGDGESMSTGSRIKGPIQGRGDSGDAKGFTQEVFMEIPRKTEKNHIGHKENQETDFGERYTTFCGPKCILSNFYPCQIKVFNVIAKSSEHAYQYKKAMEHNAPKVAQEILEAELCKDAKDMGNRFVDVNKEYWDKVKGGFMYYILEQKARQVKEFHRELLDSGDTVLVESVQGNLDWASGLNEEATKRTPQELWPGQNKLGKLLMKLRKQLREEEAKQKKVVVSMYIVCCVVINCY